MVTLGVDLSLHIFTLVTVDKWNLHVLPQTVSLRMPFLPSAIVTLKIGNGGMPSSFHF